MRLIPEKNAIVFQLENPNRILTAIPTAKPINVGDYNVAIPYELDETRLLNNLGVPTPSPINHQYKWPGLFTPFFAQAKTAAMLTLNKRAYVLNEVGTGKSMSILWAYDYLRSKGRANKLLVTAPLSTLERTWADEVFTHLPHLSFSVIHGSKAQRLKALSVDADIYIINHHGVQVVVDVLRDREDITHVAVDELAILRNQRTDLWKSHNAVINKSKTPRTCWGMTGTPTPNSPTDAWAQVKLVTPETAARSFMRFRDMTMHQRGPYRWVPRADAMETVKEAMAPAVRFTRDECMDLPDCMYESRLVELTPEQGKAYKSMQTQLMAEAAEGQIIAVNEAVKVNKLVQIACGIVYNSDGDEVLIEPKHRMAELLDILDQSEHKVIVYVPYVSTINMVSQRVAEAGHAVEVIYGGVSKKERDRIFGAFQKGTNPRVLVAQPAAMSHGLTLTQANIIVWYAPVMSNETYEQANGRITRPGQKNKQFIIHIEGTPIETKIYKRLKEKQSLQGVLLDSVKKNRSIA
jgi:SNF2 family DNA or RNA helicase